jgi:hypothetical protein
MINTNPSTTNTLRCPFQFSDCRSCRMLRNPAHPTFCTFHARQELQSIESQRLGNEISMSLNGGFLTATDINHVLGKLFIAVAQDRVPVCKATWARSCSRASPTSNRSSPSPTNSPTGTKSSTKPPPSPPLPPSPTPIPPTKTSPSSPIQTPPKKKIVDRQWTPTTDGSVRLPLLVSMISGDEWSQ